MPVNAQTNDTQAKQAKKNRSLQHALQMLLPEGLLLLSQGERLVYERDANGMHTQEPLAVALPRSVEEVQAVMKACVQLKLPITSRGAGTGQAGGAVPSPQAVVLSFARMSRLLELQSQQRWACVEPGLVNAALNATLLPYGLQFAPDPSSQVMATVGGNIGANAGGLHGLRNGVTRDHILGLEVVNSQGERFQLGGAACAASPLALESLILGSEGTFAAVTKAWVRLTPLSPYKQVHLLSFATEEEGCLAVTRLKNKGLTPAAMELMDSLTMRCVNSVFAAGFPQEAAIALLIELEDNTAEGLAWQEGVLNNLLKELKPLQTRVAHTAQEQALLWKARRGAAASYGQLAPSFYVLDCVVPSSRLAEALQGIQAVGMQSGLAIANVFHAGDGNLHPHLMFDPKQAKQVAQVLPAAEAIVKLCLALGGVLSGEHGVALEKKDWLPWAYQNTDLEQMHAVQAAWNPTGLMNPGKSLPQRSCCGAHAGLANASALTSNLPLKGTSPESLHPAGMWI
jgi:glycolate oxidase subunit GlcD